MRVPLGQRLVAAWAALPARRRSARAEDGFGMIELLCAMIVLAVGVLAVFGMFQSSLVQIRRAASISTAAALADSEMERFRAVRYSVIGLDDAAVDAADTTYTTDGAHRSDTPVTTLSAGITATATTVTVASASGFPATEPFFVMIGSEILRVEAGAGTTTWTVKRGQENTVAAAHSAGASVARKQRVHLPACGTAPCTTYVPTRTAVGADARSYRIDTYVTWDTPTNTGGTTGRSTKRVTLVVRDVSTSKVLARVSSAFDESTGL